MCPLFVHVKWLNQQVGEGMTLIEPCSAIPKEEMVRSQDTKLQFYRHRLFIARHANQPIADCEQRFTCSMFHMVKLYFVSLWLMVCFLSCFRMLCPSSLESLRVWCWHLLISLPSAIWRLHTQKLSWLCQADNKCCKGPEDCESWRMNLCHLPWCPGRCPHDWSPHWALGRLSSEIKNKRSSKKHQAKSVPFSGGMETTPMHNRSNVIKYNQEIKLKLAHNPISHAVFIPILTMALISLCFIIYIYHRS